MPIFSKGPRTPLYSKQMQVKFSQMPTLRIVLIEGGSTQTSPHLESKFAHLAEEKREPETKLIIFTFRSNLVEEQARGGKLYGRI